MRERVIKCRVAPHLLTRRLLLSRFSSKMARETQHRKLSTDIPVCSEFSVSSLACGESSLFLPAHGARSRVGAALLLPIGIPLLILLALGTPALTRRVTRRRRWLVASGDADMARAAWLELTDDLADLGMPCAPGETPRAVSGRISRLAGFDSSAAPALTRIADAEERARYALRPVPGDGLASDVRVVRKAAAATVGRRPTLHRRVLLQGAMGASEGIPRPLSQEPLSAVAENREHRSNVVGQDRCSGVSHHRGRSMGLSCYHPI